MSRANPHPPHSDEWHAFHRRRAGEVEEEGRREIEAERAGRRFAVDNPLPAHVGELVARATAPALDALAALVDATEARNTATDWQAVRAARLDQLDAMERAREALRNARSRAVEAEA